MSHFFPILTVFLECLAGKIKSENDEILD